MRDRARATPFPIALRPAQRGYEPDWLGNTFSIAVFLGNGLVAIVAGLLAHGLVEVRRPDAASSAPSASTAARSAVVVRVATTTPT